MDANIKASEERIDDLSKDELAADDGAAKAAVLSADSMLEHVTIRSFDAAVSNMVKQDLLPVGSGSATYSPEVVAKMKHALEESATKKIRGGTNRGPNYRPWWMTALVVGIASLLRRGRKKPRKAETPHSVTIPPPSNSRSDWMNIILRDGLIGGAVGGAISLLGDLRKLLPQITTWLKRKIS